MTDIPILGQKPLDTRPRSSEEMARDQRLAAQFAQLALEADAGNVRACAFVVVMHGDQEEIRSGVHDELHVRHRLGFRVQTLANMLMTSEANMLMAAAPPQAVRSQAQIEGRA